MMTAANLDDLFSLTLSGEYDDDKPWEAVRILNELGTQEVFTKAAEWCRSDDPRKRARGADILGQIGESADHPTNSFPAESYAVLVPLVEQETDPGVLGAAITALGHIGHPPAVPLIARFAAYPDPDVRFDVAFALSCYPNDPESIEHLARLMRDEDEDVRDWATFGLGVQSDIDSPEIREALLARLEDPDDEVREEAIAGLSKRHDQRVLPALFAALGEPEAGYPVIEAACHLLEIAPEPEDWTNANYAEALRKKFK